jgi:hypothetical protein
MFEARNLPEEWHTRLFYNCCWCCYALLGRSKIQFIAKVFMEDRVSHRQDLLEPYVSDK